MVNPKISVITINLNNAAGLKKTIDSVVAQLPKHHEFIVIDGDSSDGSVEIIKDHSAHISFWLSEKDKGIYDAMNKGILNSKGEYLLFLNSGDVLHNSDVLQKAGSMLKADVVSGDLFLDYEKEPVFVRSEDAISISYFRRISLFHQATFVKRSLFDTLGLYNVSFRIAGDYEFFIRALIREKHTYAHIPLTVCNYNVQGMSNDPKLLDMNLKERELAWELNFNKLILDQISELHEIKSSGFFWIINKTRRKGFFYYFFKIISAFFLGGYRLLEKLKLTK